MTVQVAGMTVQLAGMAGGLCPFKVFYLLGGLAQWPLQDSQVPL